METTTSTSARSPSAAISLLEKKYNITYPENSYQELEKAADLLNKQQKSSIIVMQNNRALGIWTEADAMTLDLSDPNLFDIEISQLMRTPVITIQEWKPLSDAVKTMRTEGIRHLLVVDKFSQPSGIISQTDLVQSHGVE